MKGNLPRTLLLLTLLLAPAGCAERPQPPARAAVTSAVEASTAAPAPSAAPAVPVTRVSAGPPQPTTLARSEFLRELACDAHFFPVNGRTFVACERELLFVDDAGAFQSDAAHALGLNLSAPGLGSPRIVAMAGQWPKAAWAATVEVTGGGNSVKLRFFRWQKERWWPAGADAELSGAHSWVVFPWDGNGLVALAPRPLAATRLLVFGVKPLAVPALTKAVKSKAETEQDCGRVMVSPEAWAQLAPDDVMVFSSQLCGVPGQSASEESHGFFGLERLRAGQKSGELTLLPVPAELPRDTTWFGVVAAALSPTDVLVMASGASGQPGADESGEPYQYVAHSDGQQWRTEVAPLVEVRGLWAQAGAFWATDARGGLWLRRHARWSAVEWSEPASFGAEAALFRQGQISQIQAGEAGTLWLVRSEERPGGAFTSRIYRVRLAP